MTKSRLWILVFILLAISAGAGMIGGQQALQGTIIDRINVRSGPGVEHPSLTGIDPGVQVVIEGRNAIGDWLLMHTPDNSIRGWVASRYVTWEGDLSLAELPVVGEIVSAPGGAAVSADPVSPGAPESIDAMHERLWNVPVLYNDATGAVVEIFRRGQSLGNNPRVFMKVGDSMTALQPFLLGFGSGMYDLGGYGQLQATLDFFSTPLNSGEPNSFIRYGASMGEGFQSGFVLDPLWTNPASCPAAREPLLCEYTLNRPAVALVLFGPIDIQFSSAENYRANMTRIVQELIERGVIPVLSTFPSANWFNWEPSIIYNNAVIDIAEQYDLPLINLWRATQLLPHQGIHDDGFHLTTWRTESLPGIGADESSPYRFTGEEEIYGVTLRNLLTLQMLERLRVGVLQ